MTQKYHQIPKVACLISLLLHQCFIIAQELNFVTIIVSLHGVTFTCFEKILHPFQSYNFNYSIFLGRFTLVYWTERWVVVHELTTISDVPFFSFSDINQSTK